MSEQTKIQASIIVSLFGFFIGGIININNELINIFLSAITGGIIVFFIFFLILNILFKNETPKAEYKNNENKGKKLDITINDADDLINNYLNK